MHDTSIFPPSIANGVEVQQRQRALSRVQARAEDWGWLPILSIVGSLGLLIIAFAESRSRAGTPWSEALFWTGFLVLLVPLALRLSFSDIARQERIGLVAVLGLGSYVVKVLHSPVVFTFSDEWMHAHNVQNVLQSHHLFQDNPLLAVTPLYPGLASVTDALVTISGLPIFVAGLIVIGTARLVLIMSLYLIYERVSASAYVAGMATVFYMGNSNFVFWGSQYAYESLALPLAILTLYVLIQRDQVQNGRQRIACTVAALIGIGTVVITHHMSSYFLVAFFVVWAGVRGIVRQRLIEKIMARIRTWHLRGSVRRAARLGNNIYATRFISRDELWNDECDAVRTQAVYIRTLGPPLLLTLVAVLAWLVYIATFTVDYLSPVLTRAVISVVKLIVQEEEGRQLFTSSAGVVAPLWSRAVGIGSVVCIVFGLPFGLWQIWKHHAANTLALVLAAISLVYFPLQAMRLTPSGWETSNRAAEFLFVGISFVLSLAVIHAWIGWRKNWFRRILLAAYISVICVGGVIVGWQPNVRMAQPYQVAAGTHIVEPQGATAARWMRAHVGDQLDIATDQSNARYLMLFGDQHPITGSKFGLRQALQSDQIGRTEELIFQVIRVQYVLLDQRTISWDNMAGYYFNRMSPGGLMTDRFDAPVFQKFDKEDSVNRLFDSGDIVIYDVRSFSDRAPR